MMHVSHLIYSPNFSENEYKRVVKKKLNKYDYDQDQRMMSDEQLACQDNHGKSNTKSSIY